MEIQVTARPHMLLETVELLYTYVNDFPVERLAGTGMYCLSESAVREMIKVACAGIGRDDPAMVYYFGAYTLPEESHRQTCIARQLAYHYMFISRGSVAADCDYLRQIACRYGMNSPIVCIEEYSARCDDRAEAAGVPLLDSIRQLGLSDRYTQKLVEQFSDYPGAVSRLQEIVTPVAQKLESMLEPWVARAEPLAQLWRDSLSAPEAVRLFLDRIHFQNREQIQLLALQLRYLSPDKGPGMVSELEQPQIYIHLGVAVSLHTQNPDQFCPWEFEAMHLLGNPMRLQILHALWDCPMTTRELAKALNLNLGNLCRDISQMYKCHLLILETVAERVRYRTNREMVKTLGEHLTRLGSLELIKP